MNRIRHTTIFNRKNADRNYSKNSHYLIKNINFIKSKFQCINVKDTKNNEEFKDDDNNFKCLTLYYFMNFKLSNFSSKLFL